MIIQVCCFTDRGFETANKLFNTTTEYDPIYRNKEENLKDWTKRCFELHLPILFVGACGIAVRTIAPYVEDKLYDSPVIVMDEAGAFVIPILSGHLGGANELACDFAKLIGAQPVITTATDVNNIFSVDVFAKKNGFHIVNRKGIQLVSSKLLGGNKVTMSLSPKIKLNVSSESAPEGVTVVINDTDVINEKCPDKQAILYDAPIDLPTEAPIEVQIEVPIETQIEAPIEAPIEVQIDELCLRAKRYAVGVGCKKDTPFEKLRAFFEEEIVNKLGIDVNDIYAFSSIDLKKHEMGLMMLAQFYHIPLITYSAEELENVEGEFNESDFVKQTTGVGSVCERSAVLCGGGRIVLEKTAKDGMTLAVAGRIPQIDTW